MQPNAWFTTVLDKIYQGNSPYAGFPGRRYSTDDQGWNSHHSFLDGSIKANRPNIVLELGVWKGGSAIHMAKSMRAFEHTGVIIAVDTWLGSWEHWENEDRFADLITTFGYPSLYYTFLSNVVLHDVQDYIIPLPLDSGNAAFVISRKNIQPEMIHIDAGHDYDAVMSDLRRWWPILIPGGVLIADDYDPAGVVWPSVRDAVNDFLKVTPHCDFEALAYKCRFRKPA